MKNPCYALFILINVFFLCLVQTGNAEIRTMVITPFTVTSESGLTDLDTGLIDLFSSRIALKNQIDIVDKSTAIAIYRNSDKAPQERILEVGIQTHADYILTGSLDESVKGISVQAFVLDTLTGKPILELSEKSGQYENADAIIPIVDVIAAKINRDLFSRDIPEDIKPQQQDVPFNVYAHPDKLLELIPKKEKK
ncbi:MAG: hypothetical protein KKD44_19480 [Proteobacteria bacterium]|nr:hypothetical protein [Pseudomonadota bacterium]